jgi:transcriptional regulator with XRE-family HTH domain
MLPKNIGIQIRQKRIHEKMTLEDLAEASDTSVAFISRIERRTTESVSLAKLLDILNALDMVLADIFGCQR